MKKILIIILIAFTATSVLTILFTFQASSTFRNFTDDDDDDDNGDDSIDNLGFVEKRDRENTQISILIDQINQYWRKDIITFKKLF